MRWPFSRGRFPILGSTPERTEAASSGSGELEVEYILQPVSWKAEPPLEVICTQLLSVRVLPRSELHPNFCSGAFTLC